MNQISEYLITVAKRVAATYAGHPDARASMISGSAAEGVSDRYSDIDMMIYYKELPSDSDLEEARIQNCGGDRLWQLGSREGGAIMESYPVDGIECQIVHTTMEAWENQMREVLERFDIDSPLQKALTGMLNGIPLSGDEQIDRWKAYVAAYPDGLRDKMVTHNLSFSPVWQMGDRFFGRDANLWFHLIRVETLQKLLGILAGINRVYYTTFQFKHMAAFIRLLTVSPPRLNERIETLLAVEPRIASNLLGELVTETIALVEREMPQIDTTQVRQQLERRFDPWTQAEPGVGTRN